MTENKSTKQRTEIGMVTSNKMDKTIVVLVERRVQHPVYKKIIKRSKKFHAHDPENQCNIGDRVMIGEGKPVSKTKSWRLLEILERAD
ncbi:MAG: 30S ribosomal protein S17 [Gammaproteobacteria bacterium RIFCSPHIGHO2_12_FULL_35_23]|nr:MAG: 30S ribosomal protein S17 [Gammaproteobacteria bacterium RIFCSPHIGHO2_12_FULL_35_23]